MKPRQATKLIGAEVSPRPGWTYDHTYNARLFAAYKAGEISLSELWNAKSDLRLDGTSLVAMLACSAFAALFIGFIWVDKLGNYEGYWCEKPSLYYEPTAACLRQAAPDLDVER